MRSVLILLLLLASCKAPVDDLLYNRPPGLDIAQVALANGAPETALHVAQTALAANPRNVPALIEAANAQAALGQREQAVSSFKQALAAAPDDANAALGLGLLQLATDPAAAAIVLQHAAANDQRNVAVLVDLGIANDLLGQHDSAQHAYRAALAVEPGRVAAAVNLGLSLALSGDLPQALSILRPLVATPQASPRMRQDLAAALVLAGDNQEAELVLHADMPQPQVLATMTAFRLLQVPRP